MIEWIIKMDMYELIGSTSGIIGALIMATKSQTHSHWAWSLWLLSSISLTTMALNKEMVALAVMQSTFVTINVLGLKNSLTLRKTQLKKYN